MDEVLYIAGESSLRLAETGGKQKTKIVMPDAMLAKDKQDLKYKTPEELRVDARMYLIATGRRSIRTVPFAARRRLTCKRWEDRLSRPLNRRPLSRRNSSGLSDQWPVASKL